jgi:sigma-B regulation protein RsbU (phosphoserine phosphatase)
MLVNRAPKTGRIPRSSSSAAKVARATGPQAAAFHVQAELARREELAGLRRERKEMQEAIAEAAQLQRKLCAPREFRRGCFEIAGELFPVRYLSGDFFKIFEHGSRVCIALGDVAGKGISAGLLLPHLLGLIRMCTRGQADPGAAMVAINRELCEAAPEPPMAALFLALLDPQTGDITYCNAGQPPALLLRRDRTTESLQEGGPLLGAVPDAAFESGRARMDSGDALMAYSDGVAECRNARGEEFSTRRLFTAADVSGAASASRALFSMLAEVLDFANGRPLADDLSMLVVHRRSAWAARPAAA